MFTLSKKFFTSFFHISHLVKKKYVETVAVCRAFLDYNLRIATQGVKKAIVPNITSLKTSLW